MWGGMRSYRGETSKLCPYHLPISFPQEVDKIKLFRRVSIVAIRRVSKCSHVGCQMLSKARGIAMSMLLDYTYFSFHYTNKPFPMGIKYNFNYLALNVHVTVSSLQISMCSDSYHAWHFDVVVRVQV